MALTQSRNPVTADFHIRLAQELVGEEPAAHADLAMDAPDRKVDPFRVEGFLPGKHVLVDAVDECAVQIEQEDGFDAHALSPGNARPIGRTGHGAVTCGNMGQVSQPNRQPVYFSL